MRLTKRVLRKLIKEELEAELEGSDQKKWFTVKGLRPGDKSGRNWIELAIVELPESFTITNDYGLWVKLTEEGYNYVDTNVPGIDPEDNQVVPREKPVVIPWKEGASAVDLQPAEPLSTGVPGMPSRYDDELQYKDPQEMHSRWLASERGKGKRGAR